jgi:hypothetical protein
MDQTFAKIILVALAGLTTVVVVRGMKRQDPALKIVDESMVGIIGVLFCLPSVFPHTRVVAFVGATLVILRALWKMIRKRST